MRVATPTPPAIVATQLKPVVGRTRITVTASAASGALLETEAKVKKTVPDIKTVLTVKTTLGGKNKLATATAMDAWIWQE